MRFAKPSEKRTLDLGCGGDGAQPRGREPVVGIDIDLAALTGSRGGRLLVCGRGEQLPFKDASFSHAGSGVALPYMRIPFAVREVFRVLRPGGSVRMSLHPWTMTVSELGRAIRAGNLRNTLFRCYILLNGACFHLTGHMFSFPLKRARLESFQTSGRMTRVLVSAGFEAIHWEKSRQFVVTARKPEV